MNTKYINATDNNHVWFALNGNSFGTSRKSSHFGDFDHLRYQIATLENTVDDLLVDRAKLYRTATASICMLSTALRALDKNKTHITRDHIERVIDDLTSAIAYADTNPDQH